MSRIYASLTMALACGFLAASSACSNDNKDAVASTDGAAQSTDPNAPAPADPNNPGNPGNPGSTATGIPGNPGSTATGIPEDTSPQGPGPGAAEIPNSPACQGLVSNGLFVGDVAPNVTLVDNLGRAVNLHSFCEHSLLVLAGASTCPTCNERARVAARLMRDRFTDGRVKLLYLLSLEGSDEEGGTGVPATLEHARAFHEKHQFGPNALTLVDGDRKALNALWPDHTLPMNSMVLRRGFVIVTKGPGTPDFEADLMTALNTPDDPPPEPEPQPEPQPEGTTSSGGDDSSSTAPTTTTGAG